MFTLFWSNNIVLSFQLLMVKTIFSNAFQFISFQWHLRHQSMMDYKGWGGKKFKILHMFFRKSSDGVFKSFACYLFLFNPACVDSIKIISKFEFSRLRKTKLWILQRFKIYIIAAQSWNYTKAFEKFNGFSCIKSSHEKKRRKKVNKIHFLSFI